MVTARIVIAQATARRKNHQSAFDQAATAGQIEVVRGVFCPDFKRLRTDAAFNYWFAKGRQVPVREWSYIYWMVYIGDVLSEPLHSSAHHEDPAGEETRGSANQTDPP